MSILEYDGIFIADTARVVGEVTLAAGVNIWYGVAIRGDVAPISLGVGTNVQDQAVIHCDKGFANVIGAHVTIGHSAICHGESIGDGSLIGMGAKVLGHTKLGRGCLIAAGALVPEGMEVPDGMVAMGVPAKIVRPVSDRERQYLLDIPPRYVENARRHAQQRDDAGVKPWIEHQRRA